MQSMQGHNNSVKRPKGFPWLEFYVWSKRNYAVTETGKLKICDREVSSGVQGALSGCDWSSA